MLALLFIDKADWPGVVGPTHVVGIGNRLIPIYLGAPLGEHGYIVDKSEDPTNFIGLWVSGEHYEDINHNDVYILIHDPDIKEVNERLQELIDSSKKDSKTSGYDHYHIMCKVDLNVSPRKTTNIILN